MHICQIQHLHSCNIWQSKQSQGGRNEALQSPFYNKQTVHSARQSEIGAEPRGVQCPQGLHICVDEHTAMQAHLQQDQQLYQCDTHTEAFPLSQESLSAHAQPQTSKFRANRVSFRWTPSQYSHDLSHPLWGSAKHAEYKNPPLSLPLFAFCLLFEVQFETRKDTLFASFIHHQL